jgi:hypothetical protein
MALDVGFSSFDPLRGELRVVFDSLVQLLAYHGIRRADERRVTFLELGDKL